MVIRRYSTCQLIRPRCPESQPFVLKAISAPKQQRGRTKNGCPARYRYIRLIAKIITLRNLPAILKCMYVSSRYGEITRTELRTNKEHSCIPASSRRCGQRQFNPVKFELSEVTIIVVRLVVARFLIYPDLTAATRSTFFTSSITYQWFHPVQ